MGIRFVEFLYGKIVNNMLFKEEKFSEVWRDYGKFFGGNGF